LNNSSGTCNLGLNYESISNFNFSLNNGKIYDPENRFVYSYEPNETFSISGEVSSGQYSYYINGTPIVLNKYKTGLPVLITDYYLNTNDCIAEAKIDILGQKQNLNISLNDKFYDGGLLSGTILVDKNFNFKIISGSASSTPINFAINYIPNKTGYFTIQTSNLTQTETKKSYIVNLDLYTNFGKITRTFYTTGILSSDLISIFQILDNVSINPYFTGEFGETVSNKYNLSYNITTGDTYSSARADKNLKIKFEYFGGFTGQTTGEVFSSGILNNFLLTGDISGSGYISNYVNAKLTGTAAFSVGSQNNTNQITGQKNIYIEQPFSINQNNLTQTIEFIGTGYLNSGIINDTNFIATGNFYNGVASGYIEKFGILTSIFNQIVGSGYYNNAIYSGLIGTGFLYINKYFTGNSIYNLNNQIGTGIATGFSTGVFFSSGYASASVSGFITGSGFLTSDFISYNATGKLSGDLNNLTYVKNVNQKFLSPKVATGNFNFNVTATGQGTGTVLYFEDLSVQDSSTYNPNPNNWGIILLSNQKLTGYGNVLNNDTYSSLSLLNKNNYFKKIHSQISNIYAINDKDQLFTTGINNTIASGVAIPNNSRLTSGVEKIALARINWGMVLYKNGLVSGFGGASYILNYLPANNLTGVKDIFASASHGVALLNNQKITGWGLSSVINTIYYSNKSYLTGINKIISNTSYLTSVIPCFVSFDNGKIETLYTPTSLIASGIRGVRYKGYFNDDPNFFNTGDAYSIASSDDQKINSISGFEEQITNYSWEWFGYFKPTTSENYTFYTNSDDGSYVWVGSNALTGYNTGNALVQNGGMHSPVEKSGTVNLTVNSLNPIRIQYGDAGGGRSMTFAFSSPTISKTTNCSGNFYYSADTYNDLVFQANKYLNRNYKHLAHNRTTVLAVTPNDTITGWGVTGDFSQVKNFTGVEKVYINEDSAFALFKNHTVSGWSLRSDNATPNSVYEFPTNIYSGKSLSGIEINSYGYKYINATGFISGIGYLTGVSFGSLLDEEGEMNDTNYTGTILYKANSTFGDSYGLIGKKYFQYFNDDPDWFSSQNILESGLFNSINDFAYNSDVYSYEWTGLFYTKNGSGNYTFYTNSDDASYVWVGISATFAFTTGNALVKNGGLHGFVEKSGTINLAGSSYYPIRVQFGNAGGFGGMNLKFASPGSAPTSNGSGFYFNNEIDIDNPSNIFYNFNVPATGFGLVTGINTIDYTFTGSKTITTNLTGNIVGSGYVASYLPSHPYVEDNATGYYRLYQDFDFKYYLTTGNLKSPRYSEFIYFTGNNNNYISNDICSGLSIDYNETNFIYSGKNLNVKYTGNIYGSGVLSPSGTHILSVTGYLSGDMQKNTMSDGLYGRAYTGGFDWAGNLPDYFISPSVVQEYPNTFNFSRSATVRGQSNYYNDFIGYFLPKATETHTFYLLGDDAAALWIGDTATSGYVTGNSLITTKTYGAWYSGNINLTSGVYYPIRIIGSQGGGTDYVMFAAKSNSIYDTVNNIRVEKINLLGHLYSEPIYNTSIRNNFSIGFLSLSDTFLKKVSIISPDLQIKQTFTGNFNANINYLITGLASGNFPTPTILNVSGIYNLKTGLTYFPNDNGVKDFTLSNLDNNFAYVKKVIYPPVYSDSTWGTRGCIALLSNGKVTGVNGLLSTYYPYINDTTLNTLSGVRDIFLNDSYALYVVLNNNKITGLGLPTGGLSIASFYSGLITGLNNYNGNNVKKIVSYSLSSTILTTEDALSGNDYFKSTFPAHLPSVGVKDYAKTNSHHLIYNNNTASGGFVTPTPFESYLVTSTNSLNNVEKVKSASTKVLFVANPNKRLFPIGASAQPAEALFTGTYIGLTGKRYSGYFGDDPYWFNTATATVNTGYNFLTSPVPFNAGSSTLESYEFTGWFKPGKNENYTFYTYTDDASYLWLGEVALSGYNTGNALVNNGGGHGSIEKSGTINLTGSYYYPIRIQYGNGGGGGNLSLYYSGKSMTGKVSIGAYPPVGHTGASGNYFFRELDNFVKSTWENRFILTGVKDFEINNFYAMAILNDNSITGWGWGMYPDLANIIASGKTINNISGLAITNYQAYGLLDDGKLKILNSAYPEDSIIPTNIYNQTFYAADTSLKPLFPVSAFSRAVPGLLITGTGFFAVNYTGDIYSSNLNTNIVNDYLDKFGASSASYTSARTAFLTGLWKSTGNIKVLENLTFTLDNSGTKNINSIKTGSGINTKVINSTGKFYDLGLNEKLYFQYFNDDLNVIYPPKINQTILSNNENYYNGYIWNPFPDAEGLLSPISNTNIYRFKSAEINRLGSIFNANQFNYFVDYIMVYEKGKMIYDGLGDTSLRLFTSLPSSDGTGNYFVYSDGTYGTNNPDATEYAIPKDSLVLIYTDGRSPSDPTGAWNINPATNAIIYKDPPLDWTYTSFPFGTSRASFYGSDYNNFTLEWTGYFRSKQSGNYTFLMNSDDAGYMWLGDSAISGFTTGNALINNSGVHFATNASGTINLSGNLYYPLRIIYGSKNDGQNMYLTYKISGSSTILRDGWFRDSQVPNTPYQNYSGYVTSVLGTGNYYIGGGGQYNDIYKSIKLTGKLYDANGYLPVLGNITGISYEFVPGYEANINKVVTGKLLNPFSVRDNNFLSGNETFYGSGYLNRKISRTGFFSVSDFANVSGKIRSKYNFIFTGPISSGVSLTINNSSGAVTLNNLNIKQDDSYYPNYSYDGSNYNVFVKNANSTTNATVYATGYFVDQASGIVYGFSDVVESGRWYVTGNLSGTTSLNYNAIDSGTKYFNQNITGRLINPIILNQKGIVKTTISGTGALNETINGSGFMIDNISGTPVGTIFSNSFVTGRSLNSGNFYQTITGNAVNGLITYNKYVSGLKGGVMYSTFIDNITATGRVQVSTGSYLAFDNLTFNYIKTFFNTFNIKTGYYISGQPSESVDFNLKKYYKVTSSGTNFIEGHYTGDAFIDKNINSIYLQVDYLNKYDSYPLTGKISLTGYNIYSNDIYTGVIFVTGNTTGSI
jgi:hypothetical protein